MRGALLCGIAIALCVFRVPLAGAEESFYRSNDFGMRLEPVPRLRMDEYSYVLGVDRTTGGEVRRLYENGNEVRRWETKRRGTTPAAEEREFAGGVLVAVSVTDAQGDLREESEYREGLLSLRSVFEYAGRTLKGLKAYGGDGALLYSEEYLRGKGSGLREVRRTFADGTGILSSFRGDGTRLAEETHRSGDTEFRVRYDVRGRVVVSETRKAGALAVRESTAYRGESRIPLGFLEEQPGEKRTTARACDEMGRVVRETVKVAGKTTDESEYGWDGDGHRTSRHRRSDAGIEEWAWSYTADGAMEREAYTLRGKKERVVLYAEDGKKTEELYKDGELFLKVFYKDDLRVKEEVYEKGKLLRERTVP